MAAHQCFSPKRGNAVWEEKGEGHCDESKVFVLPLNQRIVFQVGELNVVSTGRRQWISLRTEPTNVRMQEAATNVHWILQRSRTVSDGGQQRKRRSLDDVSYLDAVDIAMMETMISTPVKVIFKQRLR